MLCDDDKVRVLFVVHSSGMAGAERVFLHLVKGLDRSKFLPVVVFPGKGHLVDEVKMLGIRTHIVPMKWWLAGDNKLPRLVVRAMAEILSVAAIVRMIRRFSPAVVYSSSAAIFSGAIAARLARKPHVWRVAEILQGNPDHRFFAGVANALRLIVHFSHRIVVPSKAVAEQFGRFSAGMLPPIDVVPPPADPSFVKGTGASRDLAGSDWRQRQGLAESDYLLCNVGTLCARKAQDDSIRVLALLKKSVPQSKLVLAGGGAEGMLSAPSVSRARFGRGERRADGGTGRGCRFRNRGIRCCHIDGSSRAFRDMLPRSDGDVKACRVICEWWPR